MQEPKKYFVKDICINYFSEGNQKAVLVFDGLPSKQFRPELADYLLTLGFDAHFPSHPGTWESTGKLSLESISESYNALIDKLVAEYKSVYILASSFGGTIVSALDSITKVEKILLLSPVFNLELAHSILTLPDYLHSKYPDQFRFSNEEWALIVKYFSKIHTENLEKAKSKIKFIFGNADKNIPLEKYSEITNNFDCSIKNDEHISFSELLEKYSAITQAYLNKL